MNVQMEMLAISKMIDSDLSHFGRMTNECQNIVERTFHNVNPFNINKAFIQIYVTINVADNFSNANVKVNKNDFYHSHKQQHKSFEMKIKCIKTGYEFNKK